MIDMTPRQLLVCIGISCVTLFLLDHQQRNVAFLRTTRRTQSETFYQGDGVTASNMGSSTIMDVDDGSRRPPLSDLIGDNDTDIKADVQSLLDFAVIGHPKTATTFHLHWLHGHEQVQVYNFELHSLQQGRPAELVSKMYELPAGERYKRGYKAPRDIMNPRSLRAIAEYWPKTKLVVGIRNPILWFQSFYNFRLRNGFVMPPAETLVENCPKESRGVCVEAAAFHVHLSYLGKTDPSTQAEKLLLEVPFKKKRDLPRLPNPVFLYEISQLKDSNATRAEQYRTDLQHFLGLETPLHPVENTREYGTGADVLDICEDNYIHLRSSLMSHAKAASLWIRNFFLPHPDVVVSSPEYFSELLEKWMQDPCLASE